MSPSHKAICFGTSLGAEFASRSRIITRAVAIGLGTAEGGIHLRNEDWVVFHRYRRGVVGPSFRTVVYERRETYEAIVDCAVIGVA
jgi:hypothetical protein